MPEAKFKAPYGDENMHVIGKNNHHGYHFLVARMVDDGYAASHIARVCRRAVDEMAPLDAVLLHQGQWFVTTNWDDDDLKLRRWRGYVIALEAHEQALIRYQVWATTDDPQWLARNGTPEVLVVHGVTRREADELASRVRLLAKDSVVTVKPV
jgi:hypothetical protein